MSSQIRLRLLPRARCLFDEPVQVKVDGLRSSQMVTVRARATDERGVAFSSSATYRADEGGTVDLERDPSLGGTYTGIEPTGLLWSMKPATRHKRFQRTNAMNPHVVKFSVEEQEEGGRVLAEATNERLLIGDGVSRQTIKDGNIRGVLFTPPGEGPFPAVLDLYTFGGGLSERRASLLASRGFLVLTVALYGHEDMPKDIRVVHLDYFEEAIRLLKKQDGVGCNDVGVISMSKSADLALSIASFLSGVAATVWINGCCSNAVLPLLFRGKQLLPGLQLDVDKLIPPEDESGAADGRNVLRDPLAEENRATLVPVERAGCRFLFAAAGDDHNWDSAAHMEATVARLRRHGKENFESVCYPGAGHYLEPPYGPYCPSSFHRLVSQNVMWGGEPRGHAHAEIHLWKKIQEFFRAHLSVGAKDIKARM